MWLSKPAIFDSQTYICFDIKYNALRLQKAGICLGQVHLGEGLQVQDKKEYFQARVDADRPEGDRMDGLFPLKTHF